MIDNEIDGNRYACFIVLEAFEMKRKSASEGKLIDEGSAFSNRPLQFFRTSIDALPRLVQPMKLSLEDRVRMLETLKIEHSEKLDKHQKHLNFIQERYFPIKNFLGLLGLPLAAIGLITAMDGLNVGVSHFPYSFVVFAIGAFIAIGGLMAFVLTFSSDDYEA